jgi:chloramphenicol-sensitive protein RarD
MQSPAEIRKGLLAAISAYVLWGFLPLYFKVLGDLAPEVVLAHRIVWSMPTALVLIVLARKGPEALAAVRNPRVLWPLLLSALFIAVNWTVYIWSVLNGHVLEGSLGYFMNPLVSFLLAAALFGEKFRPLQLAAIGIAFLGVLNQALVVGQFPWVSLALAVSFAIYGAVRKRVAVDSRIGFGIEAAWLAPIALAYLTVLHPATIHPFGDRGPGLWALLIAAGPLTAAPLILFGLGARRLRISTIAILQYIAPSMQFVIGLVSGEAFTPAHAVSFGLIWAGVALFTVSAWLAERRAHAPSPAPAT